MDFLISVLERNITPTEITIIENSFFLIISLPIVTTLTGFMRHVIGLKSLSVYAPIVVTFAFYQVGFIDVDADSNFLRGIFFGLILYVIVFLTSSFTYSLIKPLRMHYIPKTTIVMISVSIVIIFTILLGTLFFDRKGLIYLDIFPLLMIVTLSDTFVSTLSRKSFEQTSLIGLQTLIIGILAYGFLSLREVRTFALEYTAVLILILVVINFYIGRFVGLRLTEYFRFSDILLKEPDDRPTKKNRKK
ncbi:hypothetical protein KC669_01555 [Candidatus Dojkabacteria bacterium]|uniref:7 transmembrane helices usually fused to an inactive transglutaminase domain-containing protein n=1 Tax=Candidatus Dojkabacteria bacterium TaxID=2099670 RepID=A0A955LAQ6_9BACT|nr:hypothetical protein [Candidatus Dojkabacteria bacterium]